MNIKGLIVRKTKERRMQIKGKGCTLNPLDIHSKQLVFIIKLTFIPPNFTLKINTQLSIILAQ